MRILILFLYSFATLATALVKDTNSAQGCGGDKNAEVRSCGDPCPITCDNKDQTGPRPCPDICIINGCACKRGYVKDINGKCILPKNCPPPTCPGPNEPPPECPGPNEVYSECKNPRESCSDLSGPVCSLPEPCPAGCNCKDGYARDADGVCIEELQCPCSDPNAVRVECPNPCPRTCDNLLTFETMPCARMCLRQGCTCKDGFVLNSDGECVKPEQCPPLVCPANEEYNSCPAYCSFDADCGSYVEGFIRDCARPPEDGIPCSPRCQCKPGFVRIDGECVSPAKCCVEPNTQLVDCPAPCEATCSFKPATSCRQDCPARKCICAPGYVRSGLMCIPECDCPPPECPGPNEVYSACKNPCESCSDLSGPACSLPDPCPAGCNCKEGYARDADGVCIEELQCPCSDPNAVRVECPNPCPRTCDNLLTFGTTPCALVCLSQGCTCKDGFVFNSAGKCVKPEQCPPLVCPENEEYNSSPAYCTFDADCRSYVHGIIRQCAPPPPGGIPRRPRCQCKPGFVRIDGKCVCPTKCCTEPNTQLVDCPAPCEATCSVKPAPSCKENCRVRKCICAQGYVRNGSMCILEKDCPPPACPGENEVYSACKDPCPETCKAITTGVPGPKCAMPNPCKGGCNCKDGYVRNDSGNCIRINECPCPDVNAILKECPNPCPPTCDNLKGTKPCTKACVVRGCICKDGFVLSPTGKCIKPDECPIKCTGRNEEFSKYASACPATCENRDPSCSGMTAPGCVCKKGFLRFNGKCISIDDCLKKCYKPNEEYKKCGSTCEATCANRDPKCKAKCTPGCFCKKGFVRDAGECIAVEDCKPCSADKIK